MKKNLYFILLLSCLMNKSYAKENMVENIIEVVIENNLPYLLYEHTNQKWQLGLYNLKITRLGKPTFLSSKKHINLSFPVEANIESKINKIIFGTNINIDCKNKFVTEANIKITPTLKANQSTSVVKISVNIPPTNLNCDGLKMPIKPALDALIQTQTKSWEQDIESTINQLFLQVGI